MNIIMTTFASGACLCIGALIAYVLLQLGRRQSHDDEMNDDKDFWF